MPVTQGFSFPSDKELQVEEVNLSTPILRATSRHFGKFCDEQSKEFMLCRSENLDPRKCLVEGREVTACAMKFFRAVKKACKKEAQAHADCLEKSSSVMEFQYCRKTQNEYDKCMLSNLNLELPHLGYFSMPRIHDSKRLPPELPFKKEYDGPKPIPEDFPRQEAKYGSRVYWM